MKTLKLGCKGKAVRRLQHQLKMSGFEVGVVDGDFGLNTYAAVRAFQVANRLTSDGIVGRRTLAKLALLSTTDESKGILAIHDGSTVNYLALVKYMCSGSPAKNIDDNWPLIFESLVSQNLADSTMVLMAAATVYVETGCFKPISEYLSRFNTTFTRHNFDKYDDRSDLGNIGAPDGERYKGRGYIQLTGRANYRNVGALIGLGDELEINPKRANEPKIAAQILAAFIKRQERSIRKALAHNDLAKARRIINGGKHGLPEFERCYLLGQGAIT